MADTSTPEVPKTETVSSSGNGKGPAASAEISPDSAPAQAPAVKNETASEPSKSQSQHPEETEAVAEEKKEGAVHGHAVDAVPTADDAQPVKEAAPKQTPFDEFDAKLPGILQEVGHDEMWGVKLISPASSHIPTGIVLQKFLNANDGDVAQAVDQFRGALAFRKEKKPRELLHRKFSAHKFADLGAVTVYTSASKDSPGPAEVFTWNLYGNVKGKMDEVFVPLDEYVNDPLLTMGNGSMALTRLAGSWTTALPCRNWASSSSSSRQPLSPLLRRRTPIRSSRCTTTRASPSSARIPTSRLPVPRSSRSSHWRTLSSSR